MGSFRRQFFFIRSGPHEFPVGVGRWVAAEKPVGRSAKCYKFTYRFRPLGVVVTIRYTNLGAPGSIPFRTGEKDLKKGQKRRLFFFSRDRQIRPKPGRSQRPTPTGNSGGPGKWRIFSSPPPRGGAGLGNIQGRSPFRHQLDPRAQNGGQPGG